LDALRQELGGLGWVESQNVVIEYRFAEGRHDRLPQLAAELVRSKADVIAAGPTPPALAAKQATRTIPIVMMAVGNPVEQGLVASLAHPGGNVTGVSFSPDLEIFGKGLEFLKEIAPKVRRVAALSNPANPASALGVCDATTAARSLGLQLRVMETRGPNAFDGAFATMAKDRVEALLVLTDPLFILHRAQLADLAAQHRLASVYAVKESVEAGGLMSYGPSLMAAYRRAAVFIDKILKGAKPADLPVEQPTKFELAINLKTAKALGLTIPPSLLARADQVIE
jgi:putative ABC transport system substrate-binding protein